MTTEVAEKTQGSIGKLGLGSQDQEDLYTLAYKKNNVITHAQFWCQGGKNIAIDKGRSYCDRFKLRFIHVGPACIDIDQPYIPKPDEV